MESSRRRKDERATNDAGLLTTFRELERALAVAVRECARAVETNARRRDAQGDESLRTANEETTCLLYTSPSPRDKRQSRMPSSA